MWLPLLICISSKYKISTLDHCNCWSLVITTGMKVGRIPAIAWSPIQQDIVVASIFHCILQPVDQGLSLIRWQDQCVLKRFSFKLINNSLNLIKFCFVKQLLANNLVFGQNKLPTAKIVQDVTEVGSISINEVRSIFTGLCVESSRKHGM